MVFPQECALDRLNQRTDFWREGRVREVDTTGNTQLLNVFVAQRIETFRRISEMFLIRSAMRLPTYPSVQAEFLSRCSCDAEGGRLVEPPRIVFLDTIRNGVCSKSMCVATYVCVFNRDCVSLR